MDDWDDPEYPGLSQAELRGGCQLGLLILLPLSTLHDHEQGRMDHAC